MKHLWRLNKSNRNEAHINVTAQLPTIQANPPDSSSRLLFFIAAILLNFSQINDMGIFQDDNIRINLAQTVKETLSQKDWPPWSPEFNPSEDLWDVLEKTLLMCPSLWKQKLKPLSEFSSGASLCRRAVLKLQFCVNSVGSFFGLVPSTASPAEHLAPLPAMAPTALLLVLLSAAPSLFHVEQWNTAWCFCCAV